MSNVIKFDDNENSFMELEKCGYSKCSQEQEVNRLMECQNLEYRKYIQYKIIYSILEEFTNEEDNSNQDLKTKISNILLSHSASQTVVSDSATNGDKGKSILGLKDITNSALSYTDRNILYEIVKSKLIEKNCSLKKHLQKLKLENRIDKSFESNKDLNFMTLLNLPSEDKSLMDHKEKLVFEQEQYINQLLQLRRLLLELTEVRLKDLPEIVEHKIKQYHVQDKINHLKSLLTKTKCQIEIFTETTYSLKAYKELTQDIKKQQQEYQNEIETLQDLKKKYAEVSSKQYNDILQSYIQYKASIEKKKILYECLRS